MRQMADSRQRGIVVGRIHRDDLAPHGLPELARTINLGGGVGGQGREDGDALLVQGGVRVVNARQLLAGNGVCG